MIDSRPDNERGKPARVLVLDDHGISRRYAVAALRQAGVAVKASGNPTAALQTAVEWLPQAVVVDVDLPGTDGRQWIEGLRRQWPGGRPLPRFVLLSAEWPEHSEGAQLAYPPMTRLCKPASPLELRTAVGLGGSASREQGTTVHRPVAALGVASLFRDELKRRLPELDDHLAERDLAAAAALLHQLLAASRMCHEHRVERGLRVLLGLCRSHAATTGGSAEIARSYFQLLGFTAPLMDAPEAWSG